MEELAKNYWINTLLEFYGPLLTPTQRRYMRCYYVDDYSLGEISENFHVSRQAVFDSLHRTELVLERYERRLHLYRLFQARNLEINRIRDRVKTRYPDDHQLLRMIKTLENLENK